jgi:hypothetical protein
MTWHSRTCGNTYVILRTRGAADVRLLSMGSGHAEIVNRRLRFPMQK